MISVIISVLTCLLMIASILFFPKIKLGKVRFSPYWVIVLVGATVMLLTGQASASVVRDALTQDTAINPLKILVLFISMTVLSVYLDELGFFRYLACVTLRKAKTSQWKLFLYLYLTVSVLTVFTSNDIIILSFTPFICYFAKNAKIDPIPYLAAEFVAANTWSMALVIGNPTNIYLATAYGIDFLAYLKIMILPTLSAGVAAFGILLLLFFKRLRAPLSSDETLRAEILTDRADLIIGVIILACCTVLLAVSSYIGLEMWLVALCSALVLFLAVLISSLLQRRKPKELAHCILRAPWQLIPFVLSMFVMIIALGENGVTGGICSFLGEKHTVFSYGAASFLFANIINNIPMSVLFSSVIESVAVESTSLEAMFATVVGSNIGAFLTPIGALAGIMWSSILNDHGIKFGYFDFLKIGICTSIPTLAAALGVLCLLV